MVVEYNAGSIQLLEVVFFDFDVHGRVSSKSWWSGEVAPDEILEEVEACAAGSRSLLCMWRDGGEVGKGALSCDFVRSTLLQLVAGHGSRLLVHYVPVVQEDLEHGLGSSWRVRDGVGFVCGGIRAQKKAGRFETIFEARRVFRDVEVSFLGAFDNGKVVSPIVAASQAARRCSFHCHDRWSIMALIASEAAAVAQDAGTR